MQCIRLSNPRHPPTFHVWPNAAPTRINCTVTTPVAAARNMRLVLRKVKLLCIILPPSCQSTQAGLRLSTDPELPGASPVVLGLSIPTYPVQVFLQSRAHAAAVSLSPGMRMRSVRWEQSATEDAEDEARIEATPTIDSQ